MKLLVVTLRKKPQTYSLTILFSDFAALEWDWRYRVCEAAERRGVEWNQKGEKIIKRGGKDKKI